MGSAGLDAALLYAAVHFEAGKAGLVREVVVGFASPAHADQFALDTAWSDYQVCPLWFLVDYTGGTR